MCLLLMSVIGEARRCLMSGLDLLKGIYLCTKEIKSVVPNHKIIKIPIVRENYGDFYSQTLKEVIACLEKIDTELFPWVCYLCRPCSAYRILAVDHGDSASKFSVNLLSALQLLLSFELRYPKVFKI